jgi:hypothetical protein
MTRTNRITFIDGLLEQECHIGEPLLKTMNGVEMLVLPQGEYIPLSHVLRFNGISFFQ